VLLLSFLSFHKLLVREHPHDLVDVALVLSCLLHRWLNWWWKLLRTNSLLGVELHRLRHLLLNCRTHTHSRLLCLVLLIVLLTLIISRIAILLLRVVLLAIGHSCHAILILEPLRIHTHVVVVLPSSFVVV